MKPFETDRSLYSVDLIDVWDIEQAIKDEMKRILPDSEVAEKQRKEREEKALKNSLTCDKCGDTFSISIRSKACDGNFVRFPEGTETRGYCPTIKGLCDGDGAMMDVCLSCGHLIGFNPQNAKQEVNDFLDEM